MRTLACAACSGSARQSYRIIWVANGEWMRKSLALPGPIAYCFRNGQLLLADNPFCQMGDHHEPALHRGVCSVRIFFVSCCRLRTGEKGSAEYPHCLDGRSGLRRFLLPWQPGAQDAQPRQVAGQERSPGRFSRGSDVHADARAAHDRPGRGPQRGHLGDGRPVVHAARTADAAGLSAARSAITPASSANGIWATTIPIGPWIAASRRRFIIRAGA